MTGIFGGVDKLGALEYLAKIFQGAFFFTE